MSNKDLSRLTKKERMFYNKYMNYVNEVWREWFASKGSFRAMSITEKEKQLSYYRDKLDKINRKLNR